jgi:hypothetical protein
MTENQIEDGDLSLIAPRASAANGEIVVALIDGQDATVERLYRARDGLVRLQPANDAVAPLRRGSPIAPGPGASAACRRPVIASRRSARPAARSAS